MGCLDLMRWLLSFIIYVILYLYYRFLCSIICLCGCKRKCYVCLSLSRLSVLVSVLSVPIIVPVPVSVVSVLVSVLSVPITVSVPLSGEYISLSSVLPFQYFVV